MAKEKIIGIDLGTTNSAVAVIEGNEPVIIPNNQGKRTTPSIIAFTKENERKIGHPAKRQAIINPALTISSIKQFMGKSYQKSKESCRKTTYKTEQGPNDTILVAGKDRNYTPQELSAMILQKMKSCAQDYLGKEVKKAVITVPAYFGDAERQATKEAGTIAGLEVMRIINEPTAAAMAYGLDKKNKDMKIAVFDLGGGTYDNSILEIGDGVFEVKATNGDVHLGGDNFDQTIIDWLAKEFKKEENIDLRKDPRALQRLKEAAEKGKMELSSSKSTEFNLPYITVQNDTPKHLLKTLTRAQFEHLIQPYTQKIIDLCQDLLKKAKIKDPKKEINEVILVGGSTRIPKIQKIVEQVFQRKPSKGVNPDEVVALGASIQAGVLSGDLEDNIVLLDVTPISLGIETMGGLLTKVIEQNTTIPTKKSQTFSTAQNNQPSVQIHVSQGERPLIKDNRSLGKFNLDGIPPAPRGVPQIEVTFDIDANGILDVHAKDKGTGKEQKIRIENSSNLSKEDIERMKQEAKANEETDKKEKEKIDKLNTADALILRTETQLKEFKDKLSENNKKPIEQALEDLKKVYELKDLNKIEEHSKTLEQAWQKASEEIYKATQQAKETSKGHPAQQSESKGADNKEPEAHEAEFEEVKK